MNTKEISILIDGLVNECELQNIPTRPKEEIKSLLESWDKK